MIEQAREERKAARRAAVKFEADKRTCYGGTFSPDERADFMTGFDAGYQSAQPAWREINGPDDLPKVECNIWLQNPNGEIFTDAFAPSFPGNTLKYYLEKVAWAPNPEPEPFQGGRDKNA